MYGIGAGRVSIFFYKLRKMNRQEFEKVLNEAAFLRGCRVSSVDFNDDENVFDVTLGKADGQVDIADCEAVHRAVLAAFDRNVEDYALTVGSEGIPSDEADEILKTIND